MEHLLKKAIEIKNLSYAYPDGKTALENINLDVFEGESIGIVGPNGAGKTTLILHLNGILRGNCQLKILDMEMNSKNLKNIRSKVGLVFQNPEDQLFSPTVFEDVSFGPLNMRLSPEEVRKRTEEALAQVEMEGFENRSSHHLSEGEKRRISIATVFSMKPGIVVLDEPTSNLDPKHRRELIELLKKFKTTMIIVSHDLEAVLELCERTVLVNKGKIVEDGKTAELMKNEKLMEYNSLECPLSIKLKL